MTAIEGETGVIENVVNGNKNDSNITLVESQTDTVPLVGSRGELQGFSITTTNPDGSQSSQTINLVECEECQ